MAKGIIRMCYKKVIDASAQTNWEKYVFEDTYKEFFMQSQLYSYRGNNYSFQELVANVPDAEKLHYLVSTAAINYIRQLNDLIPDIMNVNQELCLPFKNFRFKIIQSHTQCKEKHKIAIYFYSEPVIWIDTIDNKLLVAYEDQQTRLESKDDITADLIAIQPFLNITSFQNL